MAQTDIFLIMSSSTECSNHYDYIMQLHLHAFIAWTETTLFIPITPVMDECLNMWLCWNFSDRETKSMEYWWNDTDRGKQKYWENPPPPYNAPFPPPNPKKIGEGPNPGFAVRDLRLTARNIRRSSTQSKKQQLMRSCRYTYLCFCIKHPAVCPHSVCTCVVRLFPYATSKVWYL